MPVSQPHVHHIFVDFENVSFVDLDAIAALPVFVTLLIGKNQSKIDTALVEQIHAHADKVRLITLGASGRNALDLTLAYYLGRAAADNGNTQLHIVSKDKDFDPLMAHLRSRDVIISRAESFRALPFLPAEKADERAAKVMSTSAKIARANKEAPGERSAKLIARLQNPSSRNRPSNESALLAHIRTALGKEGSAQKSKEILRHLQEDGQLTIQPNGKVVYRAT